MEIRVWSGDGDEDGFVVFEGPFDKGSGACFVWCCEVGEDGVCFFEGRQLGEDSSDLVGFMLDLFGKGMFSFGENGLSQGFFCFHFSGCP